MSLAPIAEGFTEHPMAGGGSGSFAIQLDKRLAAHVTGVDNAAKLDFTPSLGANEVIDYRCQDMTRPVQPY